MQSVEFDVQYNFYNINCHAVMQFKKENYRKKRNRQNKKMCGIKVLKKI